MSEATPQSGPAISPEVALGGKTVIVYDGVCGLCNRFIAFAVRRDRAQQFLFAPLQGAFARDAMGRHGLGGAAMETMALVLDPGTKAERVLLRSDAVAEVLARLGGIWRAAAWVLRLFPTGVRDAAYRTVARNRYRFFGRSESCALPPANMAERFLP